ncbi:protein-tyrosine sulfotransferase isoform X2 [Planococcus citri]|uniref:protein-tyrosine sulfotransferase isoform X2 n=1 Tax=Planococcus citri TaxID=170843 RepID=UPI0031F79C3E
MSRVNSNFKIQSILSLCVTMFRKIRLWCMKVNNDVSMSRGRRHKLMLILLICTFLFIFISYKFQGCDDKSPFLYMQSDAYKKAYVQGRQMPLIFIGGVPRSGTTLMRAILDAHPEVRCGQETRVVPRILQMRQHWMKSAKESVRLMEAGVSPEVLDSAVASFILDIIVKHGEPAGRLCNKDPLTLKNGDYLMELFPNSKFIFMVRDGRATVHSIISRKVTITGFDLTDYEQCMKKWNDAIYIMYNKCLKIGSSRCMIVYYEQLVLHPKMWTKQILEFLDIPWHESVLHHDEHINKPGGVVLSKVERSSDQVIKPINLEALKTWVGKFPEDVLKKVPQIAPMLGRLGYDPYAVPPNYGLPDAFVQNNTNLINQNKEIWLERAKNLSSQNQFSPGIFNNLLSPDSANLTTTKD